MKYSTAMYVFFFYVVLASVVLFIAEATVPQIVSAVAAEPSEVADVKTANDDGDESSGQKFKFIFGELVKVESGFYDGNTGHVFDYRRGIGGYDFHVKLNGSMAKYLGVNTVWIHESVLKPLYPR